MHKEEICSFFKKYKAHLFENKVELLFMQVRRTEFNSQPMSNQRLQNQYLQRS